ncbi:hypothetical protein BN12_1230009 [Nostocoides japonicum T1-X7]|uniref:Uncharacterized protein n=1 Tax=Nostocoides japonicum T1-X7 TaxID=1194083 RepID=A0A077LTB5_9MICO|nr:hypothetical protein BN12_1230009 [Tetrasphaera japonica T1-X7]
MEVSIRMRSRQIPTTSSSGPVTPVGRSASCAVSLMTAACHIGRPHEAVPSRRLSRRPARPGVVGSRRPSRRSTARGWSLLAVRQIGRPPGGGRFSPSVTSADPVPSVDRRGRSLLAVRQIGRPPEALAFHHAR